MLIGLFCKPATALKAGNVRYGFEHMNRLFKKRQNVSRKHVDAVIIQDNCCNLAMIETVFPQFNHFFCKFFFRATA